MHALREFIQERMDTRSWAPADLARESGLSLQLVSQLLNDDRDVIANPPKSSTVSGLARAFRVEESTVMRAAFAAMGYQLDQTANVADLSSVPSAQLLRVLADRLGVREEEYHRGNTAPIADEVSESRPDEKQPWTTTDGSKVDYAKAAQTSGPKTRANRARRQAEKERIPDEHQGEPPEGGA